jgi:hypothetical protein
MQLVTHINTRRCKECDRKLRKHIYLKNYVERQQLKKESDAAAAAEAKEAERLREMEQNPPAGGAPKSPRREKVHQPHVV